MRNSTSCSMLKQFWPVFDIHLYRKFGVNLLSTSDLPVRIIANHVNMNMTPAHWILLNMDDWSWPWSLLVVLDVSVLHAVHSTCRIVCNCPVWTTLSVLFWLHCADCIVFPVVDLQHNSLYNNLYNSLYNSFYNSFYNSMYCTVCIALTVSLSATLCTTVL